MKKWLEIFVILAIIALFVSPVLAQAPESVLIKTEHYIQDIQNILPLLTRIANYETKGTVMIGDALVVIALTESMKEMAGIPKWIVTPPTEEVEIRWVHGISQCGCPDGDDNANGYNDFDYAWKLKVPKSGLISLEYAQACLGGDSIEVFVGANSSGPWTKAFTIDIASYCYYSWNPEQPYFIDLKELGLNPETDYYLRVYSRLTSLDIFNIKITAQEEIGVESSSWGKIKTIYR